METVAFADNAIDAQFRVDHAVFRRCAAGRFGNGSLN
jgi:hypothetical protein